MSRSPIPHCVVCGAPIVKMRRIACGRGKKQFRLEWSTASYCSDACTMIAYRERKRRAMLNRVFGDC